MNATELATEALYLSHLARVSPETATVWLSELVTHERISLERAREVVSAVCRLRSRTGPIEIADLVREARTSELSRPASRQLRESMERYLAIGEGQPDPEIKATIARVAAAVALSGGTRGRSEAEVRDEMRTLYREPERVRELLSESGSLESRQQKAARIAASPEKPRPEWYESEEQIREKTKGGKT